MKKRKTLEKKEKNKNKSEKSWIVMNKKRERR